MTSIKVHNDHDHPVQLLLEPSGHFFKMPVGSVFEVRPQRNEELEIHQLGEDLMVVGSVAKVIHNDEVVASWDDEPTPSRGSSESMSIRLGGPEDVRRHLMDSGEDISAKPDGALIFRRHAGRAWVVRVQWRDAQGAIHVEAPLGVAAPLDREAPLALTISRIHAGNAIPGFQILRSPSKAELDLTYWVVLMLDEQGSIATTVLDRAIKICLDMAMRHLDRLTAVAQGKPDPEAA